MANSASWNDEVSISGMPSELRRMLALPARPVSG